MARGRRRKTAVLSSFIKQFYAGTAMIPREIMMENEIEDREIIENLAFKSKKAEVQIRVPKERNEKKSW